MGGFAVRCARRAALHLQRAFEYREALLIAANLTASISSCD
jgi:hypothetical protein